MMILIIRALVILAATLLVGASAGFGIAYAWQAALPHGLLLAGIAVAMALGLEIAKPFAIHGVFTSLATWCFGRALALLCVGMAAVAFSLTAELTFQAMMRGDMVAERGAEAGGRHALDAKARRLETSLAALPAHRTMAVVDAAITATANGNPALWRQTNECRNASRPASATWCAPILTLRGELATALDAARIEGDLDAVRAALASTTDGKSIGAADPGAAALSVYATALGVTIAADRIAPWLPLIGVLALELGATFAGVLVASAWLITDAHTPHTPPSPSHAPPSPSLLPPVAPIPLHAVNAPVSSPCASGKPVKDNTRKLIKQWASLSLAKGKGQVSVADAYDGFTAWCVSEGYVLPPRQSFYTAAPQVFIAAGGKRERDGRKGISYAGLKLLA